MSNRRSINRREFFSWVTVGWLGFSTAIAAFFAMIFRYFYPNLTFEPDMDVNIGRPSQYDEGVNESFKNSHGIWIVRKDGLIYALSTICTHLGCVPNWTLTTSTFECPCHGSGYYTSGINFKGPAPRPLERYLIKKNTDGTITVSKNKVFRYEKSQWGLPNSEVDVGS